MKNQQNIWADRRANRTDGNIPTKQKQLTLLINVGSGIQRTAISSLSLRSRTVFSFFIRLYCLFCQQVLHLSSSMRCCLLLMKMTVISASERLLRTLERLCFLRVLVMIHAALITVSLAPAFSFLAQSPKVSVRMQTAFCLGNALEILDWCGSTKRQRVCKTATEIA